MATAKPQQRKSEQRDEDVSPEDDSGIARREVMRGDHLIEMADRCPQREDAGAEHGSQAQIVALEGREQPDRGEAQACRSDLELERTFGPADEAGRQPAKKTCMTKL